MTEYILVGAAVLGLLLYNARATWVLWHTDGFEPGQQIGQTLFVWLVPLIGAIVVMNVLRPDTRVYGSNDSDG